jgi:hypothetical protein
LQIFPSPGGLHLVHYSGWLLIIERVIRIAIQTRKEKDMLRRILICGVTAAICLLLVTSFALVGFAQGNADTSAAASQGQPQSYLMMALKIKPGMEADFDTFMKNELVPALKKGGVREFGVWKTALFGEPNSCVITLPVPSLAALDGPGPLVTALGQKGAAELQAKMMPLADAEHIILATMRYDISFGGAADYVPKLGLQVTMTIAPGRAADYEKNLKIATAIAAKIGVKGVWVASVGLGGNPNEYRILFLFDSFADLQQFSPPFFQAISEVGLNPQTGIVNSVEYAVYGYHPELGIQAPAQ